MLGQRIVTALVLLLMLGLALAAADRIWFQLLVAAFIAIAAWEWFRLLGASSMAGAGAGILVTSVGFAAYFTSTPQIEPWLMGAATVAWLFIAVPALRSADWVQRTRIAQLFLPVIMLTACLATVFGVLERLGSWGLLSILAVVWLADVGAYFSGRRFGRNKLAPTISPNKTIEGAIGGLIAVAAFTIAALAVSQGGGLFPNALERAWGTTPTVLILLGLAAVSITGDLFESLLKRRAGVKDSSSLLPGHGGVLDRIDALVPVLPIAGLLLMLAG